MFIMALFAKIKNTIITVREEILASILVLRPTVFYCSTVSRHFITSSFVNKAHYMVLYILRYRDIFYG